MGGRLAGGWEHNWLAVSCFPYTTRESNSTMLDPFLDILAYSSSLMYSHLYTG